MPPSNAQFCKRNHDTFVCGRDKAGICKLCRKEAGARTRVPHPRVKKQFCVNNHDTFVVGRTKWGHCKECAKIKQRKYKDGIIPKKQFCKYGHDTSVCGRDKHRTCKDCKKVRAVKDNKKHPEKQRARLKRNYWKHREERLAYHRVWDKEHRKELTEANVAYVKERKKIDPIFKLTRNLRSRLKAAIKNNQKVGSAVRDLGCSVEFLKSYFESKFYADMVWENYGSYWVIDHIKALVEFDLSDPIQFKQAVHYTNLQPLTVEDHRKKTATEQKYRRNLNKLKEN